MIFPVTSTPLFIHTLFNGMVIIGSVLILFAVLALLYRKILKREKFPKWLLFLYLFGGAS